jgi:hypothetical protein
LSIEKDNHFCNGGAILIHPSSEQAAETFPQCAYPAGVVLINGDILGLGDAESFPSGPVGNFIGEDHQGVDVLQLGADIHFRLVEDAQFHPCASRLVPIMGLQSVHPADHRDTHKTSLAKQPAGKRGRYASGK